MLNQHDTHSSFNPANQEEQNLPSWDSIMDKLTPEENEVVYNELYDRQAPMRKLKSMMQQVVKLEQEQKDLAVSSFGGVDSHVEYNRAYAENYTKRTKIEAEIRELIINTK